MSDEQPSYNEPLESRHPETGESLELGANELLEFIQRLPAEKRDIPVIVGGADEKSAFGLSVIKVSYDFEKGGPVLLIEVEPPNEFTELPPEEFRRRALALLGIRDG